MVTGTGRPGARGLWGRRGRQRSVAGAQTQEQGQSALSRAACSSPAPPGCVWPRVRGCSPGQGDTHPSPRWTLQVCVRTSHHSRQGSGGRACTRVSACVCRRIPGISPRVSRPEDPIRQLSPHVLPGQSRACTPPPTPHQRWDVSLSHFPKGRR